MRTIDDFFYEDVAPGDAYRFFQISWVVSDMMATAEKWTRVYGVGPFHLTPRRKREVVYRGEPAHLDMQVALVQSGPVQLEFIQQFDDAPSVYREIYGEGEGGFHHMCTATTRYDETIARYDAMGYPTVLELPGLTRVAYVDTYRDFGFISEVVEANPDFMGAMARIAETCANWDGKDPVRIMTRDGYRTPD